MITDLGREILNTLRKVLVQKIRESERPSYLIIHVQSDGNTCDVSCDNF